MSFGQTIYAFALWDTSWSSLSDSLIFEKHSRQRFTLSKEPIAKHFALHLRIVYAWLLHQDITLTYMKIWSLWRSKKQNVVTRSNVKAEIKIMADEVCEILWLKLDANKHANEAISWQ